MPTLFQCGMANITYFGSFIQCSTEVMHFQCNSSFISKPLRFTGKMVKIKGEIEATIGILS